MRILFVSGELTGSGLCQKLIAEKNDLRLFILREGWKNCYTGIAEKVRTWKSSLKWVGKRGLIIFDDVVFGIEQRKLRDQGYTVVGSSEIGDLLESDRNFFQGIAKKHGIEILASESFDDLSLAINFVKANPGRWVVKQGTHLSYLNYIGLTEDGSDVLRVLERYKEKGIQPVQLQKYAEGIEVGVARYFNGTDWVGPIEINHEHKKLNKSDKGPLTPEMGTIIWYSDQEIPLFTRTLGRLKPYLQSIDYRGDFDINFMVNKNHAWPLEATSRFGAPSTQIQVELHKSPWSSFLKSVGTGEPYTLEWRDGYGIAISVVVPPFPYEPTETTGETGVPTKTRRIHLNEQVTASDMEHIHFEEVSRDKEGYYWSGKYGLVFHVTANGHTISESREKAYQLLKKITIDGMFYRTDIGERVENTDLPQLKKWGWI